MMVQTGVADVVVAGGVESMSNIEHYTTTARWGSRSGNQLLYDRLDRGRERSQPEWRFGKISGMIETAENLAEIRYREGRSGQFRRPQSAECRGGNRIGKFADEIVPVEVPVRRGDPVVLDRDEGIRPETTEQTLATLRPITPGGTVTAGNSPAERCRRRMSGGGRDQHRLGADTRWPGSRVGSGGLRAHDDGHRPGRRGEQTVRPHRRRIRRPGADRDQRGIRGARCSRCYANGVCPPRGGRPAQCQRLRDLPQASHPAPPAAGSWRRCCVNSTAAEADSHWRRCVSAAARVSPSLFPGASA